MSLLICKGLTLCEHILEDGEIKDIDHCKQVHNCQSMVGSKLSPDFQENRRISRYCPVLNFCEKVQLDNLIIFPVSQMSNC